MTRALTVTSVALLLTAGAAGLAPSLQPSSRPKAVATLELANPGVEDGDKSPTAWKKGNAVEGAEFLWDRAVGHDSKSSISIKKIEKEKGNFFPYATWSQTVKNTGKTSKLRVSAYVKTDKVKKAVLDVGFKGGGDDTHQWAALLGPKEGASISTHAWKLYEGVVAVPSGAKELVIALQMYGPGTIWADDFTAEYVPDDTPASLYDENGEPKK